MKMLKLHSVDTAVDTEGNTYEMVRKKRGYKTPNLGKWVLQGELPDYDLEHTVTEWYDELSNFDLMRLTIWVWQYNIKTPYNFR